MPITLLERFWRHDLDGIMGLICDCEIIDLDDAYFALWFVSIKEVDENLKSTDVTYGHLTSLLL